MSIYHACLPWVVLLSLLLPRLRGVRLFCVFGLGLRLRLSLPLWRVGVVAIVLVSLSVPVVVLVPPWVLVFLIFCLLSVCQCQSCF